MVFWYHSTSLGQSLLHRYPYEVKAQDRDKNPKADAARRAAWGSRATMMMLMLMGRRRRRNSGRAIIIIIIIILIVLTNMEKLQQLPTIIATATATASTCCSPQNP